jgi:hypothetical protein
VLAVNPDASAREIREVDAVAFPLKRDLDSFVAHPFPLEPVRHSHLPHHLDRSLLEHASPNPVFHVLPGAVLQDDGIDSVKVQELGQEQPRGAGTNDPYLRSMRHSGNQIIAGCFSRTRQSVVLSARVLLMRPSQGYQALLLEAQPGRFQPDYQFFGRQPQFRFEFLRRGAIAATPVQVKPPFLRHCSVLPSHMK